MDTSPSSVRVSETQAQSESVMRLVEISAGYWLPRALHVVADLAIADALDHEPRSAADLAKKVGVEADALDRVLRLLASHGVFDRRSGKYVHTALSCTAQRPSAINASLCTACWASRVLEKLGSA